MPGAQRAFPNDWYELDDMVTVSIQGAELSPSLIMTSRDENYSLRASVYVEHAKDNAGANTLEFTIRRPWQFWGYTYTVAAMPFVLLVGVFLIKYSRHREELPEPYEVAFGVAATLVAILPLRSVLVPSSLPSPTRLDIFFGLGIIFLVVGSIIWILVLSERRSSTRPHGVPPPRFPPRGPGRPGQGRWSRARSARWPSRRAARRPGGRPAA